MNESDRAAAILRYLNEITEQFNSGHAIEHAYRPALKALMSTFDDTIAVNDPKHSEHGAPDFIFLKKSHDKIIKGYAEAKDITVSLDKTEKTNQMHRYGGYANLFLTDYLEFRFFRNGEKYETISLGEVQNGSLHLTPENGERLMRELEAFLDQAPEEMRSGKRLAQIMGGKARRIRDNVSEYLTHDDISSGELAKIYEMMTKLLVHDLEPQKFADMYAQTLVYGLFVARYGDTTPDDFTRSEARDLVPKSNPFLQHFFDHIVGPNFDVRLAYIVDELCEIFSVSNVQEIVHKHLRIQDSTSDDKDPIIHFYEDFLQEYDPAERKKMGAYYTPIPVVKFIVRHVDKILKEDFGIAKGLASSDTIDHWIETGQDMRSDKRQKLQTGYNVKLPRVQVLDPAVGTATFLNETIKFIHEQFVGQEGRWPAYAKDNLVKRLHGFELMMAPYTIAHLKLGMTLQETGVDNLSGRLGVYLTNTLEEGIPTQQDLFSFGLAEAVSEESRLAAEIKSDHPIMVVMGNPPYSGESSNNTPYANSLIDKYKFEPGGQNKLQERNPKWLNDDYVKFIAFAENMIEKNGAGVVAMITNNGYLDNPTFRGMRWHLAKSFDKIYVLDLHGNAKKNETSPDGAKDVNVFDIMQGVGIVIAIKTSESAQLAEVYHAELYGGRKKKFDALNADEPQFTKLVLDTKNFYFVPKNTLNLDTYELGISLNELMPTNSVGVVTAADDTLVNTSKVGLLEALNKVAHSGDSKKIVERLQNTEIDEDKIVKVSYRPFDSRYLYFDTKVVERPRENVMSNFIGHDNVGLVFNRRIETDRRFADVFIADSVMDARRVSLKETNYVAPLFVYHEDNTHTPNFAPDKLKKLITNLTTEPSPEDVLDYIYAILHSKSYREKYEEFLKSDFPRVPIPTQVDFDRLVPLGRELRELHLMKSPISDDYTTTFPIAGDNIVDKVEFILPTTDYVDGVKQNVEGVVSINSKQGFGNVPETAWNFYIGGYQPAQKWLKDRKGRSLSDEDLDQYQRIIKVLLETDRIMKEID